MISALQWIATTAPAVPTCALVRTQSGVRPSRPANAGSTERAACGVLRAADQEGEMRMMDWSGYIILRFGTETVAER